jgi:hypothetical protein
MAVEVVAPTGRRRNRGVRRNVVDETAGTTTTVLREDLADDTGVIYVIGERDLSTAVKIGLAETAHAHQRMLTFATGNPRPLELLARILAGNARWTEYRLHCALTPWSVRNPNSREWFDVRHLMTHSREEFIERALAGKLHGAGPLPEVLTVPSTSLITSTAGHGIFEPCARAAG